MVEHGFTTKLGGVSKGDYAELNLGLHVDDKREDILENRRLITEILGSNHKELVAAKQIHSDQIKVIDIKDKGRGALDYKSALEGTDALITNQPGILLTSYYADCTPILILDPVKKVIGLSHAGWKGTVLKIAQKTVLKMKEVYGTNPQNVLVGIGPAIGACCYQVDSKVIEPLKNNFDNWKEFVSQEGKEHWRFNMPLANQAQLEEIGVREENIIQSELCTCCNSDLFFSYRNDKAKTGRMASLIKLK
ncbi:peptidoglycan editing factor PgeF [Orenia marismortui]|uniref:Purine nucleoside phosphorylase n=1 Tax=Orenia marismortui TaxID=46469 RepID=A0A4R8GZ13_9FIRM|nr:peptidoglycan editing factor PgeF [Orenia marismortui]TDX49214.1 hypothetical protein C7959_11935 [Orenia marismortui]